MQSRTTTFVRDAIIVAIISAILRSYSCPFNHFYYYLFIRYVQMTSRDPHVTLLVICGLRLRLRQGTWSLTTPTEAYILPETRQRLYFVCCLSTLPPSEPLATRTLSFVISFHIHEVT